jgi:hypothetical protein
MAAGNRPEGAARQSPRRKLLGLGLGVCAALTCSASPAWSQNIGQSPLNALHHALHLNAAQESAWQAYRAQAAAPSKAQDRRRVAERMFPTLSAPQRMDLVEAEMRQELLDLQAQSQALKTFYATLSPQQKATFDAKTLPPEQGQQDPG